MSIVIDRWQSTSLSGAQEDLGESGQGSRGAGKKTASGDFNRENLITIAEWKSPRPIALIEDHTDEDIAAALQLASAPATPEALTVAVLTALNGVGSPMASAILAAIHPERYTVLDFRALESLGIENRPDSFAFYVAYRKACRELAEKHGTTLRTLDRALWQWSKERKKVSQRVGSCERRAG